MVSERQQREIAKAFFFLGNALGHGKTSPDGGAFG